MPTVVRRFARFAVVGVIATATHTAVFALAIEAFRIEPVVANALAFCVAVLVGYALNRRWTFAAHGGDDARLWRYVVGALAGLGANSLIMYVAVHRVHWSPYLGLALAVVLVPPLTFALNQFWVFRPRA
jgi:putative flippase GtrA